MGKMNWSVGFIIFLISKVIIIKINKFLLKKKSPIN